MACWGLKLIVGGRRRSMSDLKGDYDHALTLLTLDADEAEKILLRIATTDGVSEDHEKVRENSIYQLGSLYAKQGKVEAIIALLKAITPFFAIIPKARTAKIVRTLLDNVGEVQGARETEISLCLEWIEWTKKEKRSFLRQRLESKLASLYMANRQFTQSLEIITRLLSEVKKLDDKAMLVEIHLLESRCHHALKNLPKAKAGLTAARTSANAIYVPPLLQAEIDVLAGTLHAEEKDYKTAYSYFYEGFENNMAMSKDQAAILCLKYMLMCKIMTNNSDDVQNIITSKAGSKYTGRQVDAMKAIAAAHTARSLGQFEQALADYTDELKDDVVVHSHLAGLYETLLEQNLTRLLEPYSRVQIERIAELIKLERVRVEAKLSQMILDHKLQGVLDQGSGCIIIHEDRQLHKVYSSTIGTLSNMNNVVDCLFTKSLKLN